ATWLPGNLFWLHCIKSPIYAKQWLQKHLRGEVVPTDVENLDGRETSLLEKVVALKPDVVFAHDLPMLRTMVTAARACNAKVVYDSHECYPEQISLSPAQQAYFRKLETRWIGAPDLVFTVNPMLAEHMAKIYGRTVESITNAIDPPAGYRPEVNRDHFRKVLGLPASTRILLYQGGFAPKRGLENLIEAMRHVEDGIHLVFLGYNDYKFTLEQVARRLGLDTRVHFEQVSLS